MLELIGASGKPVNDSVKITAGNTAVIFVFG